MDLRQPSVPHCSFSRTQAHRLLSPKERSRSSLTLRKSNDGFLVKFQSDSIPRGHRLHCFRDCGRRPSARERGVPFSGIADRMEGWFGAGAL